jgi:hypothetical protein
MKSQHLTSFLLVCYLGLFILILVAPTATAQAQDLAPSKSILVISPIDVVAAGERIYINAKLFNEQGRGLPNKPIIFYFNNEYLRRIRTDSNGEVQIQINQDYPAGSYKIYAKFVGTKAYLPSSATDTLVIRPAVLTIETIPHQAGISFDLAGQRFVSNETGFASLEVNRAGEYSLKAVPPKADPTNADFMIRFERWGDSEFDATRTIIIKGDQNIQAGFSLYYLASQSFVGLNGEQVAPSQISSLTLKSSIGSIITLKDGQPRLFQMNRIARRITGLEATPVQYSVANVTIDGTNVVNQYQQRFYVKPNDHWVIELLLYYAHVKARDALLGFPLRTGINLEYPNEKVEYVPFGPDHTVYLGPLARGLYKMQVVDVSGMAPQTPVALSQDQDVELKVLTSTDIGLGLSLGVTLGLGLLLIGRPRLLRLPKEWLSNLGLPERMTAFSNRMVEAIKKTQTRIQNLR